jgi:hypothetical protein
MRLGLVILLCLLNTGCALWRKDKEEKVETRSEREKAEVVLKPSEALKPETNQLASPVSDRFYLRGIAFIPTSTTLLRLDSTNSLTADGDELSAEDDLGLDDVGEQARIEFDIRMRERNHVRVDYFKLNRFGEVILDRPISYGDFTFLPEDRMRTKFDWRVLGLTYTYSLFRGERFEAGAGIGLHIIEGKSEVSEPGTLNREQFSEVAPFATVAVNGAFRISKRWAITARGQSFNYSRDGTEGTLSDYHADIQYRWRKNFAVGLGYTSLQVNLQIESDDQDALFDMDNSGPEIFFRASF